jgi:tape measure domain-containing protein
MSNTVEISIKAKNLATSAIGQVAKDVGGMTSKSISHVKKLAVQLTSGLGGALSKVAKSLTSLKALAITSLAGWGLKNLAQGFIETGSKMDQMRISLDTITKGEGNEWFEKLNQWALKMPVNTAEAIESFTMMRAMGLEPSIEDMTKLVDTVSALGGQSGALDGIARALGQIKTKGKVSAEELMQLAERGVPAYQILQEQLGLTAEQVGNIGNEGIDAGKAVEALIAGMGERFGGQSEKIQSKWAGLWESMKSYWTEFKRLVMESGVMAFLEEKLGALVARIDEMASSGQLREWAESTAEVITAVLSEAVDWITRMASTITSVVPAFDEIRWRITDWYEANKELMKVRVVDMLQSVGTAIVSIAENIDILMAPLRLIISLFGEVASAALWCAQKIRDLVSWVSKLSATKAVLNFVGIGSPELPLSEKIAAIKQQVTDLSAHVSGQAAKYTIDAGGASQAVTAMNNTGRGGGAALSGQTTNYSTTTNKSVGDIVVNLPQGAAASSGNDWRQIVRNYIIPELRAARVI